jgi:dipeptidase E
LRLYLSSFDIGNAPAKLLALVGGKRRAAVVVNALDHLDAARAKWLKDQSEKLLALGFDVTELDLRRFFGQADALRTALEQIDVVWVNGGNAFILRRAMRHSGFDALMTEALARDAIVYAGFSAATVIASTGLEGLEDISDPNVVPAGYDEQVVWDGLGFLPFRLAVHYKSDHPESAGVEREVAFYEANSIPYRTLRDGEALVVQGNHYEIVG